MNNTVEIRLPIPPSPNSDIRTLEFGEFYIVEAKSDSFSNSQIPEWRELKLCGPSPIAIEMIEGTISEDFESFMKNWLAAAIPQTIRGPYFTALEYANLITMGESVEERKEVKTALDALATQGLVHKNVDELGNISYRWLGKGNPLQKYMANYSGKTRGELAKENESLYRMLQIRGLLDCVPMKKKQEGYDAAAYYLEHYPGVTRANLQKKDFSLYAKLRRKGLLHLVPRSKRPDGFNPLEYYFENWAGTTRHSLKEKDPALYRKLRESGWLSKVPTKKNSSHAVELPASCTTRRLMAVALQMHGNPQAQVAETQRF